VKDVSENVNTKPTPSASGSFPERFELLVRTAAQTIQGKDEVLRNAIVCMLAEGHVLLEDVPGVGKTSLARALAHTVQVDWHRIQFTPDLATTQFEFRPGPIFANIVVGDEINRASPKTQSAMLEVMEERTVSTDGHTYKVPRPFMVVATQNPIDLEGTYRLPEAQLDRFLMRLSMGYPDFEAERRVLRTQKDGSNADSIKAVMNSDQVAAMIAEAQGVEVSPAAEDYIISLAQFTREAPEVRLGMSPRGSIALLRAARVVAAANGRSFVAPEDVRELVPSVLTHRIIVTPEAELQGHTPGEVVANALSSVPVPRSSSGG
jgi:MoxR-like ATPase